MPLQGRYGNQVGLNSQPGWSADSVGSFYLNWMCPEKGERSSDIKGELDA